MTQKSIWESPVSHGAILKKAWKDLDLGMLDRRHPFHLPVFGTNGGAGDDCFPNLRIVVLRRFWRRPPALAFHTHIGSAKIGEIEANPQVSWLFYNPEEKFQLRIVGRGTIHTDDELAGEQWLATSFFGRRCYVGEAPSQKSKKPTSGMPADLSDREPTPEESEAGRANFAVISTTIDSMDCLELDVRGHRRSLFTWLEDGQIEKKWLTP